MIRITYEHIVEDTNQKISCSDGLKIDKTVLLNSIFSASKIMELSKDLNSIQFYKKLPRIFQPENLFLNEKFCSKCPNMPIVFAFT